MATRKDGRSVSGFPGEQQRLSMRSVFRFPVFRDVWIATTTSNLGVVIQSVAASWLMLSIEPSADMVALVQVSAAVPIALLSMIAGAMADSLDRRKLMLAAQLFMLSASLALSFCTWIELITPWRLLLLTFFVACGTAFIAPAWQASVRDMVPREELPGAVAVSSMGFNMARSFGPAIGGLIIATTGVAVAFTISAASCVPLIVVLARLQAPRTPRSLRDQTLWISVVDGIRYVAISPEIRAVLVRSFVFGIGASAVTSLMPVVVDEQLDAGPQTYGLLLGAFGIGALIGAMVSVPLRRMWSSEVIVRGAFYAAGLGAAIVGVSTYLIATTAALVVAGAGWVCSVATFSVAVQLCAPRPLVARALSLYQVAVFGGLAAGSWLWGVVAAKGGAGSALLAAAIVMLAAAMLGRWLLVTETSPVELD